MIKHLKIILYQLINWIKFKIYNAMGIRAKNVHFSDWAKVREGLIASNVTDITASSTDEEVRAFLTNTTSDQNPFYYYVVYIKSTQEIYTHGQFYNCSPTDWDDIIDKPELVLKSDHDADIVQLETTKQDQLISGTNIKTVNGVSLLGSGNINTLLQDGSITAEKLADGIANDIISSLSTQSTLPSLTDYYIGQNAGGSTDTYFKKTLQSIGSVFQHELYDKVYLKDGSDPTFRNITAWQLNLSENSYVTHFDGFGLALGVNDCAFLVGEEDGVYYLDAAGNTQTILHSGNIGNYKLSQFTDDVVAGKYLSLSGGTMVGEFAIKAGATKSATIRFSPNNAAINHWLGVDSAGVLWFSNNRWSQQYDILHSGNIGHYKSGDSDKLGGYGLTSFLLMTGRDYTEMDLNTIGGSQSIFTEIRTTEVTTTNSPYEGYGTLLSLKDGSGIAKMQFLGSYDSSVLYFRSQQNAGASITSAWKTIAFTDSNVASATKLKTPRKLWGNGFDGTEDVSGSLDVSGNIIASGNIKCASVITGIINQTDNNSYIVHNAVSNDDHKMWITDGVGKSISAGNVFNLDAINIISDKSLVLGAHLDYNIRVLKANNRIAQVIDSDNYSTLLPYKTPVAISNTYSSDPHNVAMADNTLYIVYENESDDEGCTILSFPTNDGSTPLTCGLLYTTYTDSTGEFSCPTVIWSYNITPLMEPDATFEMWFTSYDGGTTWYGTHTVYK